MKNRFLGFALALTMIGSSFTPLIAQEEEKEETVMEKIDLSASQTEENYTYFTFDAAETGTSNNSNLYWPSYYVFAGKVDEEGAEKVVSDLDMAQNLSENNGKVTVLPPIGESYGEEDLKNFIKLLGIVTNVKVIGINEGADFVNEYIAPDAYAVAGIMTYGGNDTTAEINENVAVPAYLSNAPESVVDLYVQANEAEKTSDTTYVSKENDLAQVVTGEDETLADAFKNAWETVFSKNYRMSNEQAEFYMTTAETYTEPYLLLPINNLDELGIEMNSFVNESIQGEEGQYTWFEFIPEDVKDAEDGTVPLILTLHGNDNDPRIQTDSTGWLEIASKEGLIILEPEWQEANMQPPYDPNQFGSDGMSDGHMDNEVLLKWLDLELEKYPQIDQSRIYLTGLSAGGNLSEVLAITHPELFAGVGAVSAPGLDAAKIKELSESYDGGEMPFLFICGDKDMFGMIPVDTENEETGILGAIQGFQTINGIEPVEELDFDANEYFGFSLDNQEWTDLGEKEMLTGTLSNDNGEIIVLAGVKNQSHWNYQAETQFIWDFLKNFARDTETGDLIRLDAKAADNGEEAKEEIDEAEGETADSSAVQQTGQNNSTIWIVLGVAVVVVIAGFFIWKSKKDKK